MNVSVLPIDSGPEQGQTTTRTAGLTVQATEEGTTAPTVSPAQETAETLLLLVIPEPESPPAPVSYGSNGYRPMHHYYVMPVQYSSGGGGASPAAIDAALANDEVEQEILLESFLDFIDPEFLVVDLGDEPPAQLAPDSANADTAQGGAAKTNGQLVQRIRGGRPRVALGNSTRADAEGTMPAAEREVSEPASETVGDAVSPILGFVAHYWRRFFAVTGVLLLGGAVWKGRNAWFRAARRMRQR